jgi:hypothetical protein
LFEQIITTIILGAIALPLVAVLAKLFVSKYNKGWKPFFVVASLQLLFLNTWGYNALDSVPPPVFLGAVAIVSLYGVVLGVLLYPILFFLAYRPGNWRRNMMPWVILGAVLAGLQWGPGLYYGSGISTNVDLHGRVLDIDGQPVSGAKLDLTGCGYIEKNPVFTGADGRFRVIANCRHYLIVKSIIDASGAKCLTRLPGYDKSEGYRLVYNSTPRSDVPMYPQGWAMFTAKTPHEFTCVFQRPKRLFHYNPGGVEMVPDGRVYTAAWKQKKSGDWTLEIQEGEHEGLMRFALRFERSDDKWVGPGTLSLFYPGSGLQFTTEYSYLDVAPLEDYEPNLIIGKPDIEIPVRKVLYFYAPERIAYGAMDVQISTSSNYSTTDLILKPVVRIKVWLNDDGNRAVLSHLAEKK